MKRSDSFVPNSLQVIHCVSSVISNRRSQLGAPDNKVLSAGEAGPGQRPGGFSHFGEGEFSSCVGDEEIFVLLTMQSVRSETL